jgi:hypothetical protein
VAGDDINFDGQITCRSCGAPLQGREGKDILKYFLVAGRRPRRADQANL